MTIRKMAACMMALVLMMMSTAALAQHGDITTPRQGIAVAAPNNPKEGGTVNLYALGSEQSEVLMQYYSGTVVDVLRVEGGMAKVQCGEEGASIIGYMRTQDLRYGVRAMRAVPRCYMRIQMVKGAEVQTYCDALAPVLCTVNAQHTLDTCGKNGDKWVQVMRHPKGKTGEWTETDSECGFVHMITGLGKGLFIDEDGSWLVLPAEGEMTYEQARARAIDLALENPQALVHVKEERRNREEIETFWADIRLVWNESRGSARWEIYFQAPDDYEQAFHVNMEADGTLVSVEVSNG